jgi:hypothetical protein
MPTPRPLSHPLILEWADAHHARHGAWPGAWSGPVEACPGETWYRVDRSLRLGSRGCPGGDTLAALLHRRRGSRDKFHQPPLSEGVILAWARGHHARRGARPTRYSGPVEDAPSEVWARLDGALRLGRRGLPGGTTLAALLSPLLGGSGRPARLGLAQVLGWADAHHEATGRWPHEGAAPVGLPQGESWAKINAALRMGLRGLPRGTTLARLMRQRDRRAEGLRECGRGYATPAFRVGDRLACALRGEVEVVAVHAAPIPWPVARLGNQRFLVLYADLAEAVRHESASSVALLWNVGSDTVWRWRKALGVGEVNEGTRRLKRDNARGEAGAAARRVAQEKARDPERDRERRAKIAAARRGKPRRPEDVAPAHAANRGRKHTAEARRKMREAQRRRKESVGKGGAPEVG